MLREWSAAKNGAVRAFATIAPFLLPTWTRKACERAGLAGACGGLAVTAFDPAHYGRMARRSFGSLDAALFHYLMMGSSMDWEPRMDFSPRRYLQENPDVFFAGYEPFAHYCRFGRYEGRDAESPGGGADATDLPAPSVTEMLSRPRMLKERAVVDVVIPVFGNRTLTLRAIDSVLRAGVAVPFELIVLDDASPSGMLAQELKTLAAAGLVTLIVNDRNVGFVRTANRGLLLHPDRDVVLLNSDTHVFGDWLDRLLAALRGARDIGTATPLSNAATILSYPVSLRDNAMEIVDSGEIDDICRSLALPSIDIPTAVGFCMAIRRACLEEVGVFDAVNFGRGYGEENDFCMRASSKGWRHVVASNVLVWHRGGASFRAERDTRIQEAQTILQRLHPGYQRTIRAFVDADPLKHVRSKIDSARVTLDSRPKVLELDSCAQRNQIGEELTVRLVPDIGCFYGQDRVMVPQLRGLPNLPRLNDASPGQALSSLLADLCIREVRTPAGPGAGSMLEQRLVAEARRRGIRVGQTVAVVGLRGQTSAFSS